MPSRVDTKACRDYGVSSRLEWMLPNGRGGYAMGTVSGANTRRYHGHLVAAVKPPTDRYVFLASVEAYAQIGGQSYGVSTNQYVGAVHPAGYSLLESFTCGDHAEWTFRLGKQRLAKRLAVHSGVDACTLEYENLGPDPVQLTLRPLVSHKFYHENFRVADFYPQFLVFPDDRILLVHNDLTLSIEHPGADRTATTGWYYRFEHPREAERGLDPIDDLYCPGELRYFLGEGDKAVLVAATETGVAPLAIGPEAEDETLDAALCRAARSFVVGGPERSTIIAGYPWFTDWGRDTMIALPGVCLATGHVAEGRDILRGYAAAMDGGLVPNRFSDAGGPPEYNTADATLWFVNAIWLTLEAEWEEAFASEALGWIEEVVAWARKGTKFGIAVDPKDGLLTQGAPGYQLTWMDAKVGDYVVTPRHGKPIEVNGLWVNALRIGQRLAERLGQDSDAYKEAGDQAEESVRRRYWKETLGHYLDTVDPADASLRPNQLIAMSLPFAPLVGPEAVRALSQIQEHLLTPTGVRTLGPDQPGYHGTAWPWLLGPYVSAVLKLTGDLAEAEQALAGVEAWMSEYGLGGIAEVYDGDEPQRPGGCPWQAWSVAEVLRARREIAAFQASR